MPLSLPPPHRPGAPRLAGPGDAEDGGAPKLTNTRALGPCKASQIESPVEAPRPYSHFSQASALSFCPRPGTMPSLREVEVTR